MRKLAISAPPPPRNGGCCKAKHGTVSITAVISVAVMYAPKVVRSARFKNFWTCPHVIDAHLRAVFPTFFRLQRVSGAWARQAADGRTGRNQTGDVLKDSGLQRRRTTEGVGQLGRVFCGGANLPRAVQNAALENDETNNRAGKTTGSGVKWSGSRRHCRGE